jgi:hypothetical protein
MGIIDSPNSAIVAKYIEAYPATSFVVDSVKILREAYASLSETIGEANALLEGNLREVACDIDVTEKVIEKLGVAKNAIDGLTQYEVSSAAKSDMEEAHLDLQKRLRKWRKEKSKTTDEVQAKKLAKELDAEIKQAFYAFAKQVGQFSMNECGRIIQALKAKYGLAEYDDEYMANPDVKPMRVQREIPDITEELLLIKTEAYVDEPINVIEDAKRIGENIQKKLRPDTTKNKPNAKPRKKIKETTWAYQAWRDKAIHMVSTFAESVIAEANSALSDYHDAVAEAYKKHLDELFDNQREILAEQCSRRTDYESRLNANNVWLKTFDVKLIEIERG